MAAYSGQNGKVVSGSTTVAEVTKWAFDPKCNISKWASSTTPGYKKGVAGVKDGGGSFDFKLDDTTPQYESSGGGIYEGESMTLKLYLTASLYLSVPAYIESVHFEVDMDSGDVVGGSATFTSNSTYSYSNA